MILQMIQIYFSEKLIPKYENIINKKVQKEIYTKMSEVDYEKYEDKKFYNEFSILVQQSDSRIIQIITAISNFFASIVSIFVMGSILI